MNIGNIGCFQADFQLHLLNRQHVQLKIPVLYFAVEFLQDLQGLSMVIKRRLDQS